MKTMKLVIWFAATVSLLSCSTSRMEQKPEQPEDWLFYSERLREIQKLTPQQIEQRLSDHINNYKRPIGKDMGAELASVVIAAVDKSIPNVDEYLEVLFLKMLVSEKEIASSCDGCAGCCRGNYEPTVGGIVAEMQARRYYQKKGYKTERQAGLAIMAEARERCHSTGEGIIYRERAYLEQIVHHIEDELLSVLKDRNVKDCFRNEISNIYLDTSIKYNYKALAEVIDAELNGGDERYVGKILVAVARRCNVEMSSYFIGLRSRLKIKRHLGYYVEMLGCYTAYNKTFEEAKNLLKQYEQGDDQELAREARLQLMSVEYRKRI